MAFTKHSLVGNQSLAFKCLWMILYHNVWEKSHFRNRPLNVIAEQKIQIRTNVWDFNLTAKSNKLTGSLLKDLDVYAILPSFKLMISCYPSLEKYRDVNPELSLKILDTSYLVVILNKRRLDWGLVLIIFGIVLNWACCLRDIALAALYLSV